MSRLDDGPPRVSRACHSERVRCCVEERSSAGSLDPLPRLTRSLWHARETRGGPSSNRSCGLLVEMTGGGNGLKTCRHSGLTASDAPASRRTVGRGEASAGRGESTRANAFGDAAAVDRQWRDLRYLARPEVTAATAEYERFLAAAPSDRHRDATPPARSHGGPRLTLCAGRVHRVRGRRHPLQHGASRSGAPSPPPRRRPSARAGIPIRGRITGDATVEGGDVCWIDERTLAVGRGYRTNDAGIRQLRELVQDCVDEVVVGAPAQLARPGRRFHLMSMVSPIDRDLFLVYAPLIPVPFREALISAASSSSRCRIPSSQRWGCKRPGGRATRGADGRRQSGDARPARARRRHRARVRGSGDFVSKGAAGPTCLTRPLMPGPEVAPPAGASVLYWSRTPSLEGAMSRTVLAAAAAVLIGSHRVRWRQAAVDQASGDRIQGHGETHHVHAEKRRRLPSPTRPRRRTR